MKTPKFSVTQDKKLDIDMFKYFFQNDADRAFLQDCFPEMKEEKDIAKFIGKEYAKNEAFFKERRKEIAENTDFQKYICEALAEVIEEDWAGINKVTIIMGICPISPRFLEHHAFLTSYYRNMELILGTTTHELTHFLYFKKFKKLYPGINSDEYESDSDSKAWFLSELLAPVIINDQRVQKVLQLKEDVYPFWQEFRFEDKSLLEIFTEIYEKSNGFEDFLTKSQEKYDYLDKKYGLQQKLAR